MVKVGLLAFANDGGLGAQTRRLAAMLKPDRVLIVESRGISPNKQFHLEWYKDYQFFLTNSFPPSNNEIEHFLQGLTHVFCVENPYNFNLLYYAEKMGIKVFCQSNYEFCDNLDKMYLPVPTKFLMPSMWKVEEMRKLFPEKVQYLPPPIDPDEFKEARAINSRRSGKRRFLHVIGTPASFDRNGTMDLLDAVKICKADFDLVIKSQHPLSMNVFLDDPRVKYDFNGAETNNELYKDFDVLLLPRRYGGLCLTCNEALMSKMPVVMTNISPNNYLLPDHWQVESEKKESFFARSPIDIYSSKPESLSDTIEMFCDMSDDDMEIEKLLALGIAMNNFSSKHLLPKYQELLK